MVVRAIGSSGGFMRNTITVMNAKGGVGKSTLVLALAETLSNDHGRKVLVIDSDAQASISHMLLPQEALEAAQTSGRTIVDYLVGAVLKPSPVKWQDFVITGASDVDDARSIHLLPSDTQLTLFEREVSKGEHERDLRKIIGALLVEARAAYDIVLIDSAPGLSVLTECWLREADFYVSPTRPDYISSRGLKFLREFRQRDPQMGFAESLGVIINMKDPHAPEDAQYEQWLRQDAELKCFRQAILRVTPLQAATRFAPSPRSYWAKYPGQTGACLRDLAAELIWRLAASQPGATYQTSRGRVAQHMGPSF
jgi:chromosome partitioning protein